MHRRLALAWVMGVAACAPSSAGEAPQLRAATPVLPGIDVLLRDSLHLVRGRRVGLVTNQNGVDARGVSDVERLFRTYHAPLVGRYTATSLAPSPSKSSATGTSP